MNRLLHLLLLGLLAATPQARAQAPDRFVRPPYLQWGDTVGIVSPAGRLSRENDTAKTRELIESWGLHVRFGPHCADRTAPYFAGTDAQRASDLQAMIDDPSIRAVIAYRGGYGSVRLLPLLDLEVLRTHPKWIVGFSDITTLHLALRRIGVESIHGTMPGAFDRNAEEASSAESLREALFGWTERLEAPPHPLNVPGKASGRLAGGNLTVLAAANGTPEELTIDGPTVLLIEEVGEPVYRIDRTLQQLARSGKLRDLQAVLVGHFSAVPNGDRFGVEVLEAVASYLRPLGIPVAFGFPSGHEAPNLAVYLGREATVEVDAAGTHVRFAE